MSNRISDGVRILPAPRTGGGRPTKARAEQRQAQLLDIALEHFLEKGFELATIDAIAASVGMTKRTIYARYEDKRALFRAAAERAIDMWIVPLAELEAVETESLETTLEAIARIRLRNATSPIGLRVWRIIDVESYRFPEIAQLAFERGSLPTIRYIAALLRRREHSGEVAADEPELLATAFLTLVVGGAMRGVIRGTITDPADIDRRIRVSVNLFLNGVRRR